MSWDDRVLSLVRLVCRESRGVKKETVTFPHLDFCLEIGQFLKASFALLLLAKMEEQELDLPSYLKEPKNIRSMWKFFSRHWHQAMKKKWSLRNGVSSPAAPILLPGESFPPLWQREWEPRWSSVDSLSKEAVQRVWEGRGGCSSQDEGPERTKWLRKLWISAGAFSQIFSKTLSSAHTWGSYLRPGREPPGRSRGECPVLAQDACSH